MRLFTLIGEAEDERHSLVNCLGDVEEAKEHLEALLKQGRPTNCPVIASARPWSRLIWNF
jgi:hypothetical protein